jgi:hypothetical protein
MKHRLLIGMVLCLFILSSCVKPTVETPPVPTPTLNPTAVTKTPIPTATPTSSPSATPGDIDYQLDGLTLTIPACLSMVPALTILPAQPYDDNAGPRMVYPQHRQISFSGYALTGKFFEPIIRVFPVAEYEPMHTTAASSIKRMREVLATRTIEPKNTIPLLPGYNAMQVFHAQVKFMDFQNGTGLRWLTELAQYSAPVNNRDLFYSYQGMTSDGKYWLSIMLPVNAAYLQETWDSTEVPQGGLVQPAPGSPNWSEELKSYYTLMLGMLNNTPDSEFSPALDCLDKLATSVSISD